MFKYEKRIRGVVALICMLFAMLCVVLIADAQLPTEVDETEIGITVNQLPGANLGLGGSIAVPVKDGFVAAAFQSNGSVIRGRGYAEYAVDVGSFNIVPYVNSTFKGYEISELGSQNDVGVNFEFALTEDLDVSGGVFGRSGGAFAKPNLFDLGSANGYDEGVLEGYTDADGNGLASLNPAATGLSFGDKSSVNLLLMTDFNVKDIGIAVKLMPELANADDAEATDQAIVNLNSSYELGEKVKLNVGADVGFQRYRDSGDVESEVAGIAAVTLSF